MSTQLHPYQIKGLEKAYEDIEKLSKHTRGIEIATWITVISTSIIAISGIVVLIMQLVI